MRTIIITIILLGSSWVSMAQDGGNMNYLKPEDIDKSYIGRRVYIDFYRKSGWDDRRYSRYRCENVNADKVSLEINSKKIEFIEHRCDDGLNNWFSEQYLETADKTIRIREFEVVAVDKEKIKVRGYFNIAPFEKDFTIEKSDIAQLLVKVIDNK
ncbi:MAG: hypothetical protein ACKVQW_15960 [Pyrinomonadaceae bacterium]